MDWEMFLKELSALRVSPARRAWWPWITCRDAAGMLIGGAGGAPVCPVKKKLAVWHETPWDASKSLPLLS